MAQEKKSNENKKRYGKKSGKRFGRRHKNYVDSFRWGFVEGEDREDAGLDDDLYYGEPDEPDTVTARKPKKKSSKKQQQVQKTTHEIADAKNNEPKNPPVKTEKNRNKRHAGTVRNDNKTTQIPVAECPLFVTDDEDDLNLPSYGRTPVPADAELLPPALPQETNKKHRNVNPLPKPEIPTKLNTVPTTLTNLPTNLPAAPLQAKKEQMVWDPDKREYVPLIIPEKTPDKIGDKKTDKKNIQAIDHQLQQKNELPENKHSRNKQSLPTELPKTSSTEKEPVTARNKKKHLRNKMKVSREIPVPETLVSEILAADRESCLEKKRELQYNATENKAGTKNEIRNIVEKPKQQQQTGKSHFVPKDNRKSHDERLGEIYRPISQHRGEVPPLVTSKILDPADIEAEVSGFAELGVSETMLDALKIVRYLEPTPIQSGVFKRVKAGVDIMGQAQTGTGKTAAFCIPIIEGVEECPPGDAPVALILVPTRELAVQVRDEAVRLAYGRDIRLTACYGGKPLAKQIAKLRDGIDLVVGTPGRVLDLANRSALLLNQVRWVVLDEADRMLDIGFRPDIEKILKRTPPERQTLLFSATLPPPVVRLAEKYMKSPEILDFSNKSLAVETIEQFYVTVDPERKFEALLYLLNEQQANQAIIFTRTKRGADQLAKLLSNHVESLAAIHGDLAQAERDRVMGLFRAGKLRYLVATDVVGRGIDVSGISHIINYDIPAFCDDYVHRVGRTGRMGREGVAYTFVTVQEGSELTRIEMRIDKLLKRADLKGFESFAKPSDPNVTINDETTPKPVYGKPVRKIRKAL
ncbi:MAG: DEAD/DEAH box helicase [Planctomycetaceae bacterium]|jgi:ATP-dependent RNA helicase DeaD|nr:DEAD/DEAH box helicase [Planctomycetaceae bacterium]